MRRTLKLIGDRKLFCLGVAGSSLVLHGVMAVADPLISKYLIDVGVVEHRIRLFAMLSGAVFLGGAFFRFGNWLNVLLIRRLQNSLAISITMKMLATYYSAGCFGISGVSPGYFIARIYDEPAQVASGVVNVGIGLSIAIASCVGGLAVSVYLAWRLTALLLVVVPLLFWLAKNFHPQISEASGRENEEEAKVRGTVGQVVEAYKTVKLFGLEKPVLEQVRQQVTKRLNLGYQALRTSASYETASSVILSLAEALVLVGAAYEVVSGRLSVGGLFGFMNAFWKVIGAGSSLVAQFSTLAKVNAQVYRLLDFENLPPDTTYDEASGGAILELESVTVKYGTKTVFENIDLSVAPNERVLILGPNGSGKSTIANVITGFVRPSSGNMRRPDNSRMTALLTPFHFIPGTLKENVNFDCLCQPKKDLFFSLTKSFDLADKCGADLVGAFSEGEKKKAQIIMTLLKDADLYLFDEPFAHLDVHTKSKAMEIMQEHTKGKALAVIMHGDDEFHRHFDRVIRLENGLRTDSITNAYTSLHSVEIAHI